MKKFLLILAAIVVVSSELLPIKSLNDISPLITGGSIASSGQFPYQVAIFVVSQYNFTFCSGTIIKHKWILTSASCLLKDFTSYNIVFGTADLINNPGSFVHNSTTNSNIKIHPNYNSNTKINNIALIYVEDMPTSNNNIGYLELPTEEEVKTNLTGLDVTISGYGISKEDDFGTILVMQHTKVKLQSIDVCKNFEKDQFKYDISNGTLCINTAGGRSPCEDQGGPMTVEIGLKKILIGVIGISTFPCSIGSPVIAESVFYHREWIKKESGSSKVNLNVSILAVVVVMIARNLF